MSSSLIRLVVAVGIFATLAINVVAPRLGIDRAPAMTPAMAPITASGPRLIPPPPGMR